MLSASHNRAYQEFLTLLTEFKKFLGEAAEKVDNHQLQRRFQPLQKWFAQNIASLNEQDLDPAIAPRWQSVQREMMREFKLLTTDILFLASARQNTTRTKRRLSISDRLTKLLGYTQIMLE